MTKQTIKTEKHSHSSHDKIVALFYNIEAHAKKAIKEIEKVQKDELRIEAYVKDIKRHAA